MLNREMIAEVVRTTARTMFNKNSEAIMQSIIGDSRLPPDAKLVILKEHLDNLIVNRFNYRVNLYLQVEVGDNQQKTAETITNVDKANTAIEALDRLIAAVNNGKDTKNG